MKKTPILFVCAAMMLTGCSGATATIKDKDETIMTIGDTKYTKGDEYELLKVSSWYKSYNGTCKTGYLQTRSQSYKGNEGKSTRTS